MASSRPCTHVTLSAGRYGMNWYFAVYLGNLWTDGNAGFWTCGHGTGTNWLHFAGSLDEDMEFMDPRFPDQDSYPDCWFSSMADKFLGHEHLWFTYLAFDKAKWRRKSCQSIFCQLDSQEILNRFWLNFADGWAWPKEAVVRFWWQCGFCRGFCMIV